ncbi:ABC transporter substrate-binding protein [Oxalobacteraceae bacterium OTU3CAMAD1]|nr:ABC transporter substrate-binding protein [Oxalobacteraceae bacterium OTU3CAMAD1]
MRIRAAFCIIILATANPALAAKQPSTAATAAAAPAVTLRIATERMPPSSMVVDGVITGRETDKIRELMTRTGTAYKLELLPWKRAYVNALTHDHACVYSTTRTPEREPLFKWVGATDFAEWQLWGRVDSGYTLKTLDDARKLRIGTANGDARDEFLRSRGFVVEPVNEDTLNAQKLLMRRIDLWAVSVRNGTKGPRGLAGSEVAPLLSFHRVQVYLACNNSVPDALIERLNAAVADMWRDGTMERIGRKYENWTPPAK